MTSFAFSWLHLSDIHFGEPSASDHWNQTLVMENVRQALRELEQGGFEKTGIPKPDVILVTGDIAFSGAARSEDEYSSATEWLTHFVHALGLTPRDVFLVAGNHDIQRTKKKNPFLPRLNAIRAGKRKLTDALADPETRELLLSRMEKFTRFASRFAPDTVPPDLADGDLGWVHTRSQRGLQLKLVGLNSALLANDNDEKERGRLWLGERQLKPLNSVDRTEEFVLALTHHPVNYLGDKELVEPLLHRAHAHLSGHVHQAKSAWITFGTGVQAASIASGALHAPATEGPVGYGFSIGAVSVDAQSRARLHLWPFTFVPGTRTFQSDTGYAKANRGFSIGTLRNTPWLKPAPQEVTHLSEVLAGEQGERRALLLKRAALLGAPRARLEQAEMNNWHPLLWELSNSRWALEELTRNLPPPAPTRSTP